MEVSLKCVQVLLNESENMKSFIGLRIWLVNLLIGNFFNRSKVYLYPKMDELNCTLVDNNTQNKGALF